MTIDTALVRPWRGRATEIRAHGEAVLRSLGIPPAVAPGLLAAAINPVGRDPFSPSLNSGLRSLLSAVRSRDPSEASAAGSQLMGLGGGATPLGDDYLIGAALSVWAMGEAAGFGGTPRERWMSALIPADAASRTSDVSAALLDGASRGRAPHPLHGILDPGRPGLASVLRGVTAIGATSGRGCATAVGATTLLLGDARSPRRARSTRKSKGGIKAA